MDGAYLKDELYELMQKDKKIFDFLEEGSLDGIWYWDLKNPEYEWMSPNFWKILGYESNEKKHFASEWQNLIYEEDLKIAIENFNKHLKDPNYPYNQIVRYKHKNGSTVWLRCRGIVIRDKNEKPIRMLGAHNDLTSLMETKIKLEKSEKVFKTIFESAQDGLSIIDTETKKFLLLNQKMCEMFGYTHKEMLKLSVKDIHPKEYFEKVVIDEFKKVIDGKEKSENILMLKKDGSTFYADISSKKVLFENKDCIVGVVRDITTRKKLEDKLEKTSTKLYETNKLLYKKVDEEVKKNLLKENLLIKQSRFASMGEMISMIAHQWRQPLNVVSSAITNMQIKKELDDLSSEDIDYLISIVQDQIQGMSSTINDFMNFFKPDKEKEEFELKEVFDNIKKIIDAQFKSRDIHIKYELKDKNISFIGYKREIEHVILNLLSNARDAFEEKKINNKKISISVLEKEANIDILIEDNAGGINENIIDRIFDPYFTTKEEGKGTGIGLYMTKQIIEKSFNGTISAKNTKDGVIFTINIKK